MPPPGQKIIYEFYYSLKVQIFVAILISANFLTNIVEKEIDPHGVKYENVFGVFEMFFNVCFFIELVVNMYSNWFFQFWESSWNIFDFVVVSIGILNALPVPMPAAFNMLRMMRAFRVFRLFKRVHSLNKIIVAIMHSLPGVRDAFLILAIVMSIFAILAVEFYHQLGEECHTAGHTDERFLTARGYCVGEEYYGTFSKSLYSFFQVLTGESWSEAVARPTIWFYYDSPYRAVGSGLFFVLYVLISSFVLTNVVVAVLLDKMVDPEVAAAAVHKPEDTGAAAEAEKPAEADGDGETKGDGAENGEDNTPIVPVLTADELRGSLASVSLQVGQLMAVSERMGSELESFRTEMTTMRDQVSSVVKIACSPNSVAEAYTSR